MPQLGNKELRDKSVTSEKLEQALLDLINQSYPIVEATGTNNYIGASARITSLTKGITRLTLFVDRDSTGNCSLDLNSYGTKNIRDSFGNIVTNMKANIPYNICYNGTDFILQGKGGGGDALPENILINKKVTVDSGPIVGVMSNNTGTNKVLGLNETWNIPQGFHDGNGRVTQSIPNNTGTNKVLGLNETWNIPQGFHDGNGRVTQSIPNNGGINHNLNAGQSIGIPTGYTSGGTITANNLASQTQANADASKILNGFSAWANGILLNGTATLETLGGRRVEVVKETREPAGSTYNEPTVYKDLYPLPTGAIIIMYAFYSYERSVNMGKVSVSKNYKAIINGQHLGFNVNLSLSIREGGSNSGSSELSITPYQMPLNTVLYAMYDSKTGKIEADYEYVAIY